MFVFPPNLGENIPTRGWLVLAALCAAAVVVALLQLTPAALFPAEKTDELAGVATGAVLMTGIFWLNHRRNREDGEEPR